MRFVLIVCKQAEAHRHCGKQRKALLFRELHGAVRKEDEQNKSLAPRNGLEGFITSGSPYSDTIIYQNMHFIMPNINARTCPDTSSELEQVKQSIVKCEDIVDNASYDDVYRFHPGGQLRINSERHRIKDYIRYTDYETAQVGVKYTDKNGTWERTTFTSLADGDHGKLLRGRRGEYQI